MRQFNTINVSQKAKIFFFFFFRVTLHIITESKQKKTNQNQHKQKRKTTETNYFFPVSRQIKFELSIGKNAKGEKMSTAAATTAVRVPSNGAVKKANSKILQARRVEDQQQRLRMRVRAPRFLKYFQF
jgi:hypothetical protein